MVAIVSGSGLGLDLTSKNVLGGQGAFGDPSVGQGNEQVYVNVANGNLVLRQQEDSLVGLGPDIDSVLTYNSQGTFRDSQGNAFTMGSVLRQLVLTGTVNTAGSSIAVTGFDGSQNTFTWDGTRYASTAGGGAYDTIAYTAAVGAADPFYTLTDGATQTVETYNGITGHLTARTDAQGNTIAFGYTNNLLTTVSNNDANGAEFVTYKYNSNGQLVTLLKTTDVPGSSAVQQTLVGYTYGTGANGVPLGKLQSVDIHLTPAAGADSTLYSTSYTYDPQGRVQTMSQTDGSKLTFGYDGSGRVASITEALSDTSSNVTAFTYLTDGNGNKTTQVKLNTVLNATYGYDASNQLTSVVMPALANGTTPTTKYTYDAKGNVTSIVDPAGRTVTMTYDGNGNVLSKLDADGDLTRYTYNSRNQLLTQTTSTLATAVMTSLGGMQTTTGSLITTGTLLKTATTTGWDSAAVSTTGIAGGASVSFTAGLANDGAMVGLTADPGASNGADVIDWGLECAASGGLVARENATTIDLHTTYAAGDTLSVRYDGAQVTYLKNGTVLRTVAASIDDPLYAASSFYNPGARIDNLRFGAVASDAGDSVNLQGAPLLTTELSGSGQMTVAGDVATKSGSTGLWDSSVRSVAGLTGGAAVSFTATSNAKNLMVGLDSDTGNDAGFTTLDFAVYLRNDHTLRAYRNGQLLSTLGPNGDGILATFNAGDRISVVYDGARTVSWLLKGQVIATCDTGGVLTQPLHLDSSFGDPGGSIAGIRFGGFGAIDPVGTRTPPVMVNAGGVTISGNTLTKAAGTSAWDSSARSAIGLSGGAQVAFTVPATGKALSVGLDTAPDADLSYTSMDYAFKLNADNTLEAWVGGVKLASLGSYKANDRLVLRSDGANVTWSLNGQVLKTTALVGNGLQPLYVDTSFYSSGASITDLMFDSGDPVSDASPLPVPRMTSTAGANVTISGGTITKTGGTDGTFDVAASSVNGIVGGASVAFTTTSATTLFAVGLTSTATPTSETTWKAMDYSVYVKNDGTIWAYGKTVQLASLGKYVVGDRLSVVYSANTVSWLQNGKVLFSTAATVNAPLFADTWFATANAKLTNLCFGSSDMADPFADGDAPPLKATGGIVVVGGDVTKTSGTDGTWDASARSTYSYTGAATVSFTAETPTKGAVVGLNTRPDASVANDTIDYGLWLQSNGTIAVIESNVVTQTGVTYTQGDRFSVSYDGHQIVYVKNGEVLRAVVPGTAITLPLYVDSSFANLGAKISDLNFTGGATTEQTARNVYSDSGNGTLRYTISAAGRVTEYRYSSLGLLSSTNDYVQATYSMAGLSAGAVPSEADMNAWRAMQDQTLTQRTDYRRDWRQQLTTTFSFSQTAADGSGVSGTSTATSYLYDASGLLLQKTVGTSVTNYVYDGLGRLISVKDSVGRTTTTVDAPPTTTSTGGVTTPVPRTVTTLTKNTVDDTQLQTISTFDYAGHLLQSTTNSIQGTGTNQKTTQVAQTTYDYDAAGHVLRATDATGVRTWSLYDADGRKVADIDGEGVLTQYDYDASGRVTRQTTYGTKLNPTQLATLVDAQDHPKNPALSTVNPTVNTAIDRVNWNIYDEAGRLRQTIDALGAVKQIDYDGEGKEVATTAFFTRISTTGFTAAVALRNMPSNALDRVTHDIYDADGLLVGVLDPDGYLTAYQYDGKGRQVMTLRYANPAVVAPRAAYSLAALTPLGSPDDQRTVTLYDVTGNVRGQIDAEGYLTENTYDGARNLVKSTRYATPVGTAVDPLAATVDGIRPVASLQDRTTTWGYDAANRAWKSTSYQGGQTILTFAGNNDAVVQTDQVVNSSADERVDQRRYDALGRVTQELTGVGSLGLAALMAKSPAPSASDIESFWTNNGVTYAYDAAGHRTSAKDALGNVTTYYYDNDDRLRFTIDPTGAVQELQYDAFGQVTKTARYTTALASADIGSGGRVTATLTGKVGALGAPVTTSTVFLQNGLVKSVTDAMGQTTTTTSYDTFDDILARSSTRVGTTALRIDSFTYDNRGAVLSSGIDVGSGGAALRSSTSYDAFGRVVQSIDAAGLVSTTSYDRLGEVIRKTEPLTLASTWVYDAFGEVLSSSVAGNDPTTTVYDRGSFSATVTPPDEPGHTSVTVVNHYGQVASVTDADGGVTTRSYDDDGRLLTVLDANNVQTANTYDAVGNLLTTVVATVTTVLDANGHPVKTLVGATTTFKGSYDADGRLVYSADGLGNVTKNVYDVNGHLLQRIRYNNPGTWPDGTSSPTVTASPANDRVERWVYDAAGRVTLAIDANGRATSTAYDENGNVTQTRTYATPMPSGGIMLLSGSGSGSAAGSQASLVLAPAFGPTDIVTATIQVKAPAGQSVSISLTGSTTKTTTFTSTGAWQLLSVQYAVGSSAQALTFKLSSDQNASVTFDDLEVSSTLTAANGNAYETNFDRTPQGSGTPGQWLAGGTSTIAQSYMSPASIGSDAALLIFLGTIADPANDRIVRDVYDAAGRRVLHVDATGTATQYTRDADGNVVRTRQYLTPVPSSHVLADKDSDLLTFMGTQGLSGDLIATTVYDADGRAICQVDATGVATEMIYDAHGNCIQTRVDAARAAMPLDGSVPHHVVAQAAPDSTTLPPDTLGVTHHTNDHITCYAYDASGRRVMAVVTTTAAFDSNGAFTPTGAVTETTYDPAGRVVMTTQYSSLVAVPTNGAAVDANSIRLAHGSDAGNRVTRYAYDAGGRLVYQVDSVGTITETDYDLVGNVSATTVYGTPVVLPSGPATLAQVSAALAPLKNAAIDRTTRQVFDADGRMTWSVDAVGGVHQYVYDVDGNLASQTDYAEAVAITKTTPLTEADLLGVNGVGGLLKKHASNDRTVYNFYDLDDRLRFHIDALGFATETRYSLDGLRVQTLRYSVAPQFTLPASTTGLQGACIVAANTAGCVTLTSSVHFDAEGRAIDSTDASGVVTRDVYDNFGRVTSHIQDAGIGRLNLATTYVYDAAGRMLLQTVGQAIATASGSTYTYAYDANGCVNLQPTGRSVTQYTYDAFGNKLTEVSPDGWALSHDNSAWAQEERQRLGGYPVDIVKTPLTVAQVATLNARYTTVNTFDVAGHVVSTTTGSASALAQSATATAGLPTRAGTPGVTVSTTTYTTYDAFGDAVKVVDPLNRAGYFYFDKLGRVVEQVDPAGNLVTTSYVGGLADKVERITRYKARVTTSYDENSRPVPPAVSANDAVTAYTYDKLGRVLTTAQNVDGSSTLLTSVNGVYADSAPSSDTHTIEDRVAYSNSEVDNGVAFTNIFDKVVTNKLGGTSTIITDLDGHELDETIVASATQTIYNAYVYDCFGNRIQSLEGCSSTFGTNSNVAGTPDTRVTTYFYDAMGRVVYRQGMSYAAVDVTGSTTTSSGTVVPVDCTVYDALGRVIETRTNATWTAATRPAGASVKGGVFSVTAPAGGSRSLSYYDFSGNVIETVDPAGAVVAQTWSPEGKLWQRFAYSNTVALPATAGGTPPVPAPDTANDRASTYRYDNANRLTEVDFGANSYKVDAAGNATKDVVIGGVVYWTAQFLANTASKWDDFNGGSDGDLIVSLPGTPYAMQVQQRTYYDAAGNAVQQVDGRGNSVYNYYDEIGRKTLQIDQDGFATAWDYGDAFDTPTLQVQYATMLVAGTYARQDLSSAASSDVKALRATLENAATADDRRTSYTLDRAGRVTTKSVAAVAFDYVDDQHNRATSTTAALTSFEYDALGNVTKQKMLASVTSAVVNSVLVSTQHWFTTTYSYDKLGRVVKQVDSGFVKDANDNVGSFLDQNGVAVTPTVETQYDVLGNKIAIIQRDQDEATLVDRKTAYVYDNAGHEIKQTDAENHDTTFDYDSYGRMSRTTVVGVVNAAGTLRNVVTLFQYDKAGNQVSQSVQHADGASGAADVRNTLYDVFGEIVAKGEGTVSGTSAAAYQERTYYNTMGKVERSNTGDGAWKLYLYDLNGNTTRMMQSDSFDLSNPATSSIVKAASNTLTDPVTGAAVSLLSTYSLYDKRNHLIRTVEPSITYTQNEITENNAYVAGQAEQYGAIGTSNGSAGGSSTYNPTQISGGSGGAIQLNVGASFSSMAQRGYSSLVAPSITPTGGVTFGVSAYSDSLHDETLHAQIADSAPNGLYRVVDTNFNPTAAPQRMSLNKTGAGPIVSFVPGVPSLLQYQIPNTQSWITVCNMSGYNTTSGDGAGNTFFYPHVTLQSTIGLFINTVPTTPGYSLSAFTGYGTSAQAGAAAAYIKDQNGTVVGWNVGLAPNTTLTILGTDGSGIRKFGSVYGSGAPAALDASKSGNAWIDSVTDANGANRNWGIRFNGGTINGASGTLYYRVVGTSAWLTISEAAYRASLAGVANGSYEFILKTSAGETHGTFQISNGTPTIGSNGALTRVSEPDNVLHLDVSRTVVQPPSAPTDYTLLMYLDGSATPAYQTTVSSLSPFAIAPSDLHLSVDMFSSATHSYSYTVLANHGSGASKVSETIGKGTGTFTLGGEPSASVPAANAAPPNIFLPVGTVQMPAGTDMSGTVKITTPANASYSIATTGDWRVKEGSPSTNLGIDLSQWFKVGDAAQQFGFSYTVGTDVTTGTLSIDSTGKVTVGDLTLTSRKATVALSLPCVASIKIQEGTSTTALSAVNSGITSSAPDFSWDVSSIAATAVPGVKYYFNYQGYGTDGTTIVNKGHGSFSFDSQGAMTLTTTVDYAPLFPFTPPAGTTSFALLVDGQSTTTTQTGASWAFMPPTGFTGTHTYSFIAKDAQGTITSSGHGSLSVDASGKCTALPPTLDFRPVVLTGPQGNRFDNGTMTLALTGKTAADPSGTVTISGTWDESQNCMVFVWDAAKAGYQSAEADHSYTYKITMFAANGTPITDALNEPLEVDGTMSFSADASQDADVSDSVQALSQSAQVRHMQSWNAFGQIDAEWDDVTLANAKAMAAFNKESYNADLVRTTFKYNTLGQLILKTDPETDVTDDKGVLGRKAPVTKYGYDLLGRLVSTLDANNSLTLQSYAGNGQLTSVHWNPINASVTTQLSGDGGQTLTEYDVFGDVRRTTQDINANTVANGGKAIVDFTTDRMGRLLTATHENISRRGEASVSGDATYVASTLVDKYTYDALGQRITHVNALNWTDKTFYDNLGRVIETDDDMSFVTKYDYQFVQQGASSGGLVAFQGTSVKSGIYGAGATDITDASQRGTNTGGWETKSTNPDGSTMIDDVNYFGQRSAHQDEGGHVFVYDYDQGAHLAVQHSEQTHQHIEYQYADNGDLLKVYDNNLHSLAQYGYDDAGNRITESYGASASGNKIDDGIDTAWEAAVIQYDEQGRMATIDDDGVNIVYQYDAVGNRRAVQALYYAPDSSVRQKDYLWYKYDASNRFIVSQGNLANNVITGGVQLTYDYRGDRMSATDLPTVNLPNGAKETYNYSVDGYLEETYINNDPNSAGAGTLSYRRRTDSLGRTVDLETFKNGTEFHQTSTYDQDSRLIQTKDADSTTDYRYFKGVYAFGDDPMATSATNGKGALATVTVTPTDTAATVTRTSYQYEYWDMAQEKRIQLNAVNKDGTLITQIASGISELTYNANGFASLAVDKSTNTTFVYTLSPTGLVMSREQQDANQKTVDTHLWYYAGGRTVGDVSTSTQVDLERVSYAETLAMTTDHGKIDTASYKSATPVTAADFDQSYQPINSTYPAPTAASYKVQSGDTLRGIAQAMWGDGDLWYLIAEANNLSGSETLVQGEILVIPNKVTNVHNNSNTFRPYEPGSVIGHIDPSLPPPPTMGAGGGGDGCGVVGTILMVVAACVAAYFVGPAAFAMLEGTLGATAATVVAAGVAGAAGSVASQAVGNLTGNVKGFSWKQVANAAVSQMVTVGVGEAIGAAANAAGAGSTVADLLTKGYSGAVVSSVASSAVTQGLRGEWSWRQIGAAAVGAVAGHAAGAAMGEVFGDPTNVFEGKTEGVLSAMAGGWASDQVLATDPRYTKARTTNLFTSALDSNLMPSFSYEAAGDDSEARAEAQREANRFESGRALNARMMAEPVDPVPLQIDVAGLLPGTVDVASDDDYGTGKSMHLWGLPAPNTGEMGANPPSDTTKIKKFGYGIYGDADRAGSASVKLSDWGNDPSNAGPVTEMRPGQLSDRYGDQAWRGPNEPDGTPSMQQFAPPQPRVVHDPFPVRNDIDAYGMQLSAVSPQPLVDLMTTVFGPGAGKFTSNFISSVQYFGGDGDIRLHVGIADNVSVDCSLVQQKCSASIVMKDEDGNVQFDVKPAKGGFYGTYKGHDIAIPVDIRNLDFFQELPERSLVDPQTKADWEMVTSLTAPLKATAGSAIKSTGDAIKGLLPSFLSGQIDKAGADVQKRFDTAVDLPIKAIEATSKRFGLDPAGGAFSYSLGFSVGPVNASLTMDGNLKVAAANGVKMIDGLLVSTLLDALPAGTPMPSISNVTSKLVTIPYHP